MWCTTSASAGHDIIPSKCPCAERPEARARVCARSVEGEREQGERRADTRARAGLAGAGPMHARSPCVFDCSSRSSSIASIVAFRIDSAPASATAWYLCEPGLLSEYSRVLTSRMERARESPATRRGAWTT